MKQTDNDSRGFGMTLALVCAVAILIIGVIGYFAYSAMKTAKSPSNISQPNTTDDPAAKQTAEKKGMITGKTSSPSGQLPADEEVCAERTDGTGKPICINVGKDKLETFSLSVPAAEYYVYATTNQEMPDYKAYYTQFQACQDPQDTACETQNEKVPVRISAGETVSLIEPGHWHAAE